MMDRGIDLRERAKRGEPTTQDRLIEHSAARPDRVLACGEAAIQPMDCDRWIQL
jgi:hypothetical protein